MAKKELINEKFPFIWHGGDYCPEQWQYAPEILNEDMRLFDKAGINALTVNMFAWSTIEPEEGKYDFSYLDDVFERAEKHGKLIILGTPSGARPAYMAKNIPKFCVQTSLDKKIFSEIGIIIALPHRNTGSLLRKLTENLQSVTKIQRALQCGIFQTNLTASAIVSYAKKLSENGLRCDMTIILTSLILHIGTLSGATHIRRGTK